MIERKFFGTDGIRGQANQDPITPLRVMTLALATAHYFKPKDSKIKPKVVIGKDTRLSGYMLEPALTSGFVAAGYDVTMLGPLPTPGVSHLTQSLRADVGVMISASHNIFSDNGIKIFGRDGYKLSDEQEYDIEQIMQKIDVNQCADFLIYSHDMGRAKRLEDSVGRYSESVKESLPSDFDLKGIKILVDCAHGAAYKSAPIIFDELGADVIAINNQPNGININENCGALHIDNLVKTMRKEKADIGFALDGDADRLICCDGNGNICDGDKLLAIIATSWQKRDLLKGGVVSTIMANRGFVRYLRNKSIAVKRTQVGDRYVMEQMRALGYNLGGEASGHIIMRDYFKTGDGVMAAVHLLAALVNDDKNLHDYDDLYNLVHQEMRNYPKPTNMDHDQWVQLCTNAEKTLGDDGRLVARPSGTEPKIRVMIECDDDDLRAKTFEQFDGFLK